MAAPAPLELLALPLGDAVLAHLPRLAAALAGGAPVVPYAASTPPPVLPVPLTPPALPHGLAVVVGTSGSTGTPKRALLTSRALRASVEGTRERIAEGSAHDPERPRQWLLAMPPHHVAGLQVLFRSLREGTTPVVLDLSAGFTPRAFVAATARLDPAYVPVTALVPTQVGRLLDDPTGCEALRRFDTVLVGGAATPPHLRRRAEHEGVRLVATYGMSETAGGCLYDGRPLPGVGVEIGADDRVLLRGPTLARGYLARPDLTDDAFGVDTDGVRWFRTDDLGHLGPDGRLEVHGRVDDVIVTGGLKVAPRLVENALHARVPGVREALVVGVPDAVWGEAVGVLLVLDPRAVRTTLTVAEVRAALRGVVAPHELPRRVRVVAAVPLHGPGKPDRRAAVELLAGPTDGPAARPVGH